jgi:hypothetical protein
MSQAELKQAEPEAAALQPLVHPAVWRGDDMATRSEWLYQLSADEIAELEAVGARFLADDPDLRYVRAEHYPLPVTAAGLAAWAQDLDNGRGFVLVRGLKSHLYSDALSASIFFVLGLHMGEPMRQNEVGDVFDHVIATTNLALADPKALASRTTDRLNFHSDASNVVALLCLRGAREGGSSIILSAAYIYNEVVKRRPDLAPLLFEPWHYDWYKQDHDAPRRFYTSPMISLVDGVFSMSAGSRIIRTAQEYPETPRMTPRQYELLDLLDALYQEPGVALTMDFRPGDIQWLLNYTVLHSRSAYRDYEQPERKRHLMRLWLRREGRPMVPNFGRKVISARGEAGDGAPDAPEKARFRISQICYPRYDWGLESTY